MKKLCISLLTVVLFAVMLTGCGGSGGTPNQTPNAPTISGVAAAGAPLTGTVYLKDSSTPRKEFSAPIGADGKFSFEISGLTGPFLMKAEGVAGGKNFTLCSIASAAGVANINPLSHLSVVMASGGTDPINLYSTPDTDKVQAIMTGLNDAINQLQNLLKPLLTQYNVATVNFITDTYVANHMKLDLLFDMVAISVSNGSVNIINKTNNAIIFNSTTSNIMSGQINTANIPTSPPQSAGSVYITQTASSVPINCAVKFSATVIGTYNQQVAWSIVEANGGSITGGGVYTAPANTGTYHVMAKSVENPTKSATATVTVTSSSSGSTGGWSVVNTGLPVDKVLCLAIDRSNNQVIYAGTKVSGIYKTLNGGKNWTPVNTGMTNYNADMTRSDILSLAIDPNNSQIIYAGTLSGVFKTTNGGASWSAFSTGPGGLGDIIVYAIVIDPTNNHIMYVATHDNGSLVYKTTDGGTTWTAVLGGMYATAYALSMDPTNNQVLYLGESTNGSLVILYKTINGGAHWVEADTGLSKSKYDIKTIAIDPKNSQVVYAGDLKGVYKTSNGGTDWVSVGGPTSPSSIVIDPTHTQVVYVGELSFGEVYKSIDGGTSWNSTSTGLACNNVYFLAIDPTNSQVVYAATDTGVYKTTTGGQ